MAEAYVPPFSEPTKHWFRRAFAEATEVQQRGWSAIARGEHALLVAPTGSGKTLAAFLFCLDRLLGQGSKTHDAKAHDSIAQPGVRTLYVSPLKALVYDIERNLRVPLIGMHRAAEELQADVHVPTVAIRTGDTPANERRQILKTPPDVLVTTPESLYLMLGSQARETLRTVSTVIIDEVHAMAATKRGAHLALSLERLSHLAQADPQRIGLSATARPLETVAQFIGGDRKVTVIDAARPPSLELEIISPVRDMTRPELDYPEPPAVTDDEDIARDERDTLTPRGVWPAVEPALLEEVRKHNSTIIFVNSRGLCERLVNRLNELAEEPLLRSHHGSLSQSARREVEQMLKAGQLRGLVATSSLELGIDMGAVDLVVLVSSPGTTASGLQRIGRAGHGVGQVSYGRLYPKHRGDLLEATVVAQQMRRGELEPLHMPENALDILAQHIVAMSAVDSWPVAEVERLCRRAANYRELPKSALLGVLDMLSGRYPSSAFADLRPRLVWDRDHDRITGRKGAGMLALVSGGTIPDRGLYTVHLAPDGPRVGELDEEMVHEIQSGQTFTLGASTWRVVEITRDRVMVSPAPGELGRLPFWRGEGPGRPLALGRAMGEFIRRFSQQGFETADDALQQEHGLDANAAKNLVAYLREQEEFAGAIPSDKLIVVERFRDEIGDWRICILTTLGARIHAPWALALQAELEQQAGFEVEVVWTDDGICLRLVDLEELPDLDFLFPNPEQVQDKVVEQLGNSALFAGRFRENAARALLLPRRRPGARTPLWQQRLRSQQLLAAAKEYPAFPIIVETYRECLQDVFDVPALVELLQGVRARDVRVHQCETTSASPFARSLLFAYVAQNVYGSDAPLAERRAGALALDRNLLQELLGEQDIAELLDPDVVAEVEAELQARTEDRKARHPDAVHDLLRRLGALTEEQVAVRVDGDAAAMLAELTSPKRAAKVRLHKQEKWIAVEDAGLYRDAYGTVPPPGLSDALLGKVSKPVEQIVHRFAQTHGPFDTTRCGEALDLSPHVLERVLLSLESERKLARAPDGSWCDPNILRRIKQRTLAKIRGQVSAVDARTFGRFLPAWHRVEGSGSQEYSLEAIVTQLEGLPYPFSELERSVLPARLGKYRPSMLDGLGAQGFVVWVGHGASGPHDGRVALYRRDQVAKWIENVETPNDLPEVHTRLLHHLESTGAAFFSDLERRLIPGEVVRRKQASTELLEALWDLVWRGLVTNDTFLPLRGLNLMARHRQSGRKRGEEMRASGRWSLVRHLLDEPANSTERIHARAVTLLERHGVVSRHVADVEKLPGGFSSLYPVFKAMEEAGKVRRGYFVEGVGGLQFAFSGAVDRLRGMRQSREDAEIVVLSAADPANPYGWILPWPDPAAAALAPPKRNTGALVALSDGALILYLERGGKALRTFSDASFESRLQALRALGETIKRGTKKVARVETVDGIPVRQSSALDWMRTAGFAADHKGVLIG